MLWSDSGAIRRKGFMCQPHLAHRSPPRKFLSSFFYKCILQGAIDFAALRWRSGVGGVAGFAPEPNFELTCEWKNTRKAFISLYT